MLLCAKVNPPPDGEEASDGTALHWLGHARIQKELGASGDIGASPAIPDALKFSAWIVDFYVRTISALTPPDWSLELEVPLEEDYGDFTLSGHIDCVAVSPDATRAIVYDLKTGYIPVDAAASNWQLFGYACLLASAYPDLREVTLYIIQPRNDEDAGFHRVSEPCTISGEKLAQAVEHLKSEIRLALSRRMELNTGIKQCRWCAAKLQCPAQIAERELMKKTMTKDELEAIKPEADPRALVDWCETLKILAPTMEQAEEMLREYVAKHGHADGTNVRVTATTRLGGYDIPDPLAFYEKLERMLPEKERLAQVLKPTMKAIREQLADSRGIPVSSKKGESGTSLFDEHLRPLTVQKHNQVLHYL